MKNVLALISGLVFGFGLILSGMANPAKVIGFLDIAGSWDPSLAFVMGGAMSIFVAAWISIPIWCMISILTAVKQKQVPWGAVRASLGGNSLGGKIELPSGVFQGSSK